jgi:hypothetical protein
MMHLPWEDLWCILDASRRELEFIPLHISWIDHIVWNTAPCKSQNKTRSKHLQILYAYEFLRKQRCLSSCSIFREFRFGAGFFRCWTRSVDVCIDTLFINWLRAFDFLIDDFLLRDWEADEKPCDVKEKTKSKTKRRRKANKKSAETTEMNDSRGAASWSIPSPLVSILISPVLLPSDGHLIAPWLLFLAARAFRTLFPNTSERVINFPCSPWMWVPPWFRVVSSTKSSPW